MRKILLAVFVICLLYGCESGGGSKKKIKEPKKVNEWIYGIMSKNYLWTAQLPSLEESDPSVGVRDYFDGLIYKSEDRFSHIEYTGTEPEEDTRAARAKGAEKKFDFGFRPANFGDFFQVVYVVKDSPADGLLERGDAFTHINGHLLSATNYEQIMDMTEITVEVLNRGEDGKQKQSVTLKKDKGYFEYPILVDTIYTPGEELGEVPNLTKKVAYLVYNTFADGSAGTVDFAGELKKAFGRYTEAGVKDLILDLRYNGGGEETNARLLASLLAPAGTLDAADAPVLLYMETCKCFGVKDNFEVQTFLKKADIGVGNYPGLENLYIITSVWTASASELVMYTLKEFYDHRVNFHIIGQKTVGKNVGSITYTDSRYDYEISPIVARVYNNRKQSTYAGGISPDVVRNEFIVQRGETYPEVNPLGDLNNEWTLNYVANKYFGIPFNSRNIAGDMTPRPYGRSATREPELMGARQELTLGRVEIAEP